MSTTAGEKVILRDTGVAQSDLSAAQYTFVTVDAEDQIDAATAGEEAFVLLDAPASGATGTYALVGKAVVLTGAAVTAGAALTPDANGKAVTATTGDVICGMALTGASGADELIEMLIATPVATV